LPADAVERHVDDPERAAAKAADLAAYTERVMSELVRDRVPVSTIDPRVTKYLGD
jgi:predicted regulator of Ras-like GTPase activity (Roadblock/LC7/MglB family)